MRFAERLRREIGHTRGGCPFDRFICVNSGSESVTVGARLSDINAKIMTDPGGRYANKPTRILSHFHISRKRSPCPSSPACSR
mgnify:CR=1 FL=1